MSGYSPSWSDAVGWHECYDGIVEPRTTGLGEDFDRRFRAEPRGPTGFQFDADRPTLVGVQPTEKGKA